MERSQEEIAVVVFDLNGTFYNKSSKDEFYQFILSKEPQRVHYFFQMMYYKALKHLHRIRKTEFKENFFNYLDHLQPQQVEAYAREFWEQEYPKNFNKELLERFDQLKAEGTQVYCATGGLELYVRPLFSMYPINGFAGTRVRYENGTYKVIGKACKDEEKLERIARHFEGKPYRIKEAYSDSKELILDRAEKAFLVKDGSIVPYQR
ncbi:HAD-IB family phosphatase [Pontibacter actiniarum]|uniref:Phosphoserine phosphatase n=1 Tax=Pontibacter actiniarum TaxID=323450 RepID=A0A1X9YRP5_9BACT|nr:HAD-IB family phosphatase [Pontibacter actiniarum]ARS35549.1 phosphoserine phosphatase [Pontibacter actiniarum]